MYSVRSSVGVARASFRVLATCVPRRWHGHNAVLIERHAFDPFYGRRVAYDMANANLLDVGCAGRVSVWKAGQPGGLVWQLTLAQLRPGMIETGRMTPEEIDTAITLCNDPRLSLLSPVTMAAWGRQRQQVA
jgi:hypothetical protein